MIELSWIDNSIIIIYFILLLVIGYVVRKKVHNITDYFLAGRRLTLPIFVATLVSTWYGGLLGVGELSYNYGIVNWLTQGFFWYLSYLFFAFFIAHKVRKSNLFTIPDLLEKFYDKKSRFLGAVFNFIMVTPAPYVFSLGLVFSLLFGWPHWVGILIGTLVMIFYTMRGGFMGVVYTDFIQFFLMMLGVAMIIPFAVFKFGGIGFLQANLPASHFTLTGDWTIQMILVWGFIAFWTLVDPGFYQRCYAAKNSMIPKRGILISIVFWALFDVCTTFTGMYARAAMPGIDPTTAYPVFAAAVLPIVFKGFFFTGLIATIMSTIDSFTFLGAMNISHDLYYKIFNKKASEKKIMFVTKIGIVIAGVIAAIIALSFTSLVAMWYTIGTIGISALLIPVLAGFFFKGRKSPNASFLSIIIGSLTSTLWMMDGYINAYEGWPTYIFGLEPMYPGLLMSLIVYVVVTITSMKLRKTVNEGKQEVVKWT
ncbi:sodium:solute symporter family protein [Candidatus Woesearchaeota archaeon]|nr:sodium:solute symporter family protein [Candidatus Woesearchaeota archaeon]